MLPKSPKANASIIPILKGERFIRSEEKPEYDYPHFIEGETEAQAG